MHSTMPFLRSLFTAIGVGLVAQVAAQCATIHPTSSPVAAKGVDYKVLVTGLGGPRGIVVDTAGNLLVAEQQGRGIRRVVLSKASGLDVCVKSSSQLISNANVSESSTCSWRSSFRAC